jgi:5-methylcytosine-specific restriction endonuclease McrA
MPAAKPKVTLTCKHCEKVFEVQPWAAKGRKKFCSKPCFFAGRELKGLFTKGHPDLVPTEKRGHTDETCQKISEIQRKNQVCGPEHPNWRGGKRSERKQAMSQFPYRDWRKAVFTRDNWTCQICSVRGGYLEADHIKPWCSFPELRYAVDNGRTVCRPCHMQLDTHGHKALKFKES